MAKNQAVATIDSTQSTAVALPDDLLAMLAEDAKATSALERPSVAGISLRAGILSYNGEAVKGNKLRVVIVGASHLNTYYEAKWDPDKITSPNCFSLSTDGENMVPHENVTSPISSKCGSCQFMQWGSDLKDGKPAKGKRCKESRRLVLLPESALESAEDVQGAELASVKLPVTSVSVWANFINTLDATVKKPYYAVVTELTTQPDVKSQFKVVLTPVAHIQNADVLRAVMAKRTEAMKIAMLPFDSEESEVEEVSAVKEKF